jgi:hypothetical protein
MSARFRSLIVSSALVAGVFAGPGAGSATAAFDFTVTSPVDEGSSVTVTVTRGVLDATSVNLETVDGTATSPADYTGGTRTATFDNTLDTEATVTISTIEDALDEDNETFSVRFSGTPASAKPVTITDDDGPPTVAIADATVVEGTAANPTVLAFPVTLSARSGRIVTAQFATSNGTATAGQDYTAKTATVSIPAGATGSAVHVNVTADNLDEPDETLTGTLSSPANAGPGDLTATGTIRNDDVPSLAVGNVAVTETNASQTIAFPVTLSNPSMRTITVAFGTADNSATAGSDYTATSGTLTFVPGETQKSVPVEILGDTVAEGPEAFALTLSAPAGATLGAATGIGGIADDEAPATTGGPSGPDVGFGPGVVPGGGDTTPPAMKVSRPTLARSGVLRLRMACPASERSCRGTVSVFSRPAPKSKIKALRGEVKIAKTNFVIAGGKEARLTLRLSKRVLGLLRRARTLRVTAFVVSRDEAGNVGTKQIRGTLKRPRR